MKVVKVRTQYEEYYIREAQKLDPNKGWLCLLCKLTGEVIMDVQDSYRAVGKAYGPYYYNVLRPYASERIGRNKPYIVSRNSLFNRYRELRLG